MLGNFIKIIYNCHGSHTKIFNFTGALHKSEIKILLSEDLMLLFQAYGKSTCSMQTITVCKLPHFTYNVTVNMVFGKRPCAARTHNCSIHSLLIACPSRQMIRKENPQKIPVWGKICELIRRVSGIQSQLGFFYVN